MESFFQQSQVISFVLCVAYILIGGGCESGDNPSTTKSAPSAVQEGRKEATMKLTSSAFSAGNTIPVKYTGEGTDVSVPLAWTGVPKGAKQLALICDDPDAPSPEPWVHWVIYNMDAALTGLPEGIARSAHPEEVPGSSQGINSWPNDNIGYRGPMPPPGNGTHHYHFKLYALDTRLELAPNLTKTELMSAIQGHIIGQTELVGTYQR